MDCCVVVSMEGPGWGCVSEHGEDIMMACYNETVPSNMTDVSNMDSCRQVMRICRILINFSSWLRTTHERFVRVALMSGCMIFST